MFYWILFENVMSLHRTKATFIGLLEAGRANEWVVTEKLGDVLKKKAESDAANKKTPFKLFKKPRFKFGDRYVFSVTPKFFLSALGMLLLSSSTEFYKQFYTDKHMYTERE